MKDPAWLERSWAAVTKYVKFDKIYLETHRDTVMPDQATLDQAKKFFASKGVIDVQEMKDPAWLERSWAAVTKYVKFDKIYLETHRDTVMPDQATLDQAKKFFEI